jgi:hypothetical protein
MATLASYFAQAMSNIEPGDDADHAKAAHAEVSAALRAAKPLINLGIDPVLIGSYARDVSIRRVKDVDVFGRLTDADVELRPSRAIELFETALVDGFGASRVERQDRSLKVDFPAFDLAVDVVPARPCGDHWEIPKKTDQDDRASWVETNPTKLAELTTAANATFTLSGKGIYVPTVKLVRQVRRVWVADQPGGFFFEILTYWAFADSQPDYASRAEYLAFVLDYIETELPTVRDNGLPDPTLTGHDITTRATDDEFDSAIDKIAEAAEAARSALAEEDDCKAAVQWRRLLGATSEGEQVFPMPEYCNADGTRRNTGTAIKGAVTSPAGSGRYA